LGTEDVVDEGELVETISICHGRVNVGGYMKEDYLRNGSQNDTPVFETAEKLGITFVEQGIRLFHH
jgi:hypothetical protein